MFRNPPLHTDEISRLEGLIESYSLKAARDLIIKNATPCVSLLRGKKIKRSRVGESRYGGTPDLNDLSSWPRSEYGYYPFFMQINFEDVPGMERCPLPESGLIYFFYADDWPEVECSVVYQSDSLQLQSTKPFAKEDYLQTDEEFQTTPHRVDFQLGIDLPNYGTDLYDTIVEAVGDKNAGERYSVLTEDALNIGNEKWSVGQLLGYSSELDCDMRKHAAKRDTRKSNINDWRLLWTIHSDFEVGICVGDAGSFYTLIRKGDLRKRRFDRTYTKLEV